MLLTAARWAHLSCSTYPLLLTPLTTGSWPTFSISASIFGAMRWPGLSPTLTTEPRWSPSAATHHWHPCYRPGSHRVRCWGQGHMSSTQRMRKEIFKFQRVMYHLFADDMQGHVSAKPRNARLITSNKQECMAAVSSWCASKRL